jgi:WD40 repeat protein
MVLAIGGPIIGWRMMVLAHDASESARREAEVSTQLRNNLYNYYFVRAADAADQGRKLVACRLLGECAPEQRHWEWHYLHRQVCDQSLATLAGHSEAVWCVAVHPQTGEIASGATDGSVRFWKNGELRLEIPHQRSNSAWSIGYSPQGTKLATGCNDGMINIWDPETGEKIMTLRGHKLQVNKVAFTGEDQLVSASNDETVRIWDLATRQQIDFLPHNAFIWSLAVSADRQLLATGDVRGVVRLWNFANRQVMWQVESHNEQAVCDLAFAPNGQQLASCGIDRTVRLWSVTGDVSPPLSPNQDPISHQERVNSIAWHPSDGSVMSASSDGAVRVWDTEQKTIRDTYHGHRGPVWSVAVCPTTNNYITGGADKSVKRWPPRHTGYALAIPTDVKRLRALALSPDGKLAASAAGEPGRPGEIRIWERTTGRLVHSLSGHTSGVNAVAFSHTEPLRLASASYDDTVRLWDVDSETVLHTFEGHTADVWWVSFDHRDERLASAGADGTINVWSVGGKELEHSLKAGYPVDGLAFSPDGQQIAACSGAAPGELLLWDYRSGRSPRRITGDIKQARSLAFSPDGRQIAVGGKDGIARVWSVETGELAELRGHEGDVTCIAFSSDGQRIFTGGVDRTVKLWDRETGDELLTLPGHEGGVWGITLAADGTIASIADDGRILIW